MLTTPWISPVFVEIKAVERVRDAVRNAMMTPYPSHVISEPGRGKTTALCHIVKEFDGAYLEIGEQQKSTGGLYRGLLDAVDAYYSPTAYERDLCDQVISNFKRRMNWSVGGKDLLIVDEFQTAEDRTKRELLRLQETCGFALVLSGNSERIASAGKRDERALQQINDRIGMTVHLPNLDGEDCDRLAQAYGAEGEDARLAIRALGSKTNARNLARVLQRAKAETQGTPIRLSNLKNAVLGIYGKADALKFLQPR